MLTTYPYIDMEIDFDSGQEWNINSDFLWIQYWEAEMGISFNDLKRVIEI